MEHNLVVQRSSEQRVRVTDDRRVPGMVGPRIQKSFQPAGWPVQE